MQKDSLDSTKKENLDFWYPSKTTKDLQILKNHVFLLKDKQIRDFFKICFAFTTRKVSFQKNSKYKIYREQEKDRKEHDTLTEFQKIWEKNIKNMKNFTEKVGEKHAIANTVLGNTFDAPEILGTKKPTLVVTSPPYGDHQTTVAYGQFSRHPGMWLELEEQEEELGYYE